MYISTLAMCWFQQTMSTKHSTFITTPIIIHNQDFVSKKKVFAKIAIFSIKISESKIVFRLTQGKNTCKHISRNIWATLTASRKLTHDKGFKCFSQKDLLKKIALQSKRYSYFCKRWFFNTNVLSWRKVSSSTFFFHTLIQRYLCRY